MILSARILSQVSSVNSFNYAEAVQFTQGDTLNVYLQLVDATQDPASKGYQPSGRRYVPQAGATLTIKINFIDNAAKISRSASQPFAQDQSIWMFPILPTDNISGTMDIQLVLLEGVTTTTGVVRNGISADPANATFTSF